MKNGAADASSGPDGDMTQDELRWLGRPIGQDQRALILACAQSVFSEQGYRNASMKEIAWRAGVGKTTIYNHFASKEELFLAIVRENLNHIHELSRAGLTGPGTAWQKIENSARSVLSFVEENAALLRVIFQETGEFDGGIQKQFFDTIGVNIPLGESFIRSFQEDGALRKQPAERVVRLLLDLLIGATYAWSLRGEGSLVDKGMAYLDMLKQGFLEKD
jgi:AcrR family transcriptional regulator